LTIGGDYQTHFGVNDRGLVNVYAYDVAKLPEWQRRLWAGHNASPDGVSKELLASQVDARPASTHAPEEMLIKIMGRLDNLSEVRWGSQLFRPHEITPRLLTRVHRFRALSREGLLELAKDLSRLVADGLNVDLLHSIVPLKEGQRRASIKSLERVLATVIDAAKARATLTPLAGIYELRLGDAHLPGSALEEAFKLVGIDKEAPPYTQALQMLDSLVVTLVGVASVIEAGSP
jgi:hypothetical protein